MSSVKNISLRMRCARYWTRSGLSLGTLMLLFSSQLFAASVATDKHSRVTVDSTPAKSATATAAVTKSTLIIVTADFRQQQRDKLAGSITVLDQNMLQEAGEQHFEDVLNWIPNLNFAGGTSRPRFFQIRGIGERSQYQGAPNPSVGFLVDDIDFSGIGGVATLFDVQQIEVLRGPQGMRYGANALAGLINVKTNDPTFNLTRHAQFTLGEDNTLAYGVVISDGLSDSLAYRVAVQQHHSNGFRHNQFLQRHDTNQRDEFTGRVKFRWLVNQNWQADFTLMNVILNNGYDAWAIDNTLNTQSDKPGRDMQRSQAGAIRLSYHGNQAYDFVSITSAADSDILFSFDGDWGNPVLWGSNGPYDFTSTIHRQRQTVSQELRFISKPDARIFSASTDWLFGLYALNLSEANQQLDLYNGDIYTQLDTHYSATNIATFGELDIHLSDATLFKIGARLEHRSAHYQDTNLQSLSPSEGMSGGHITLEHFTVSGHMTYASISRGYKAGGFNIGLNIPINRREFGSEFLYNFEIGSKDHWMSDRLLTQTSLFYMDRSNLQVQTSFQNDPTDPLSFTFFTDNAARGSNYGIEFQSQFFLNIDWTLFTNLGLLRTDLQNYTFGTRTLNGREQAHAPKYNYAIGADYRDGKGWFARAEITGKDSFYYSDSNDQRSKSYNLVNLKLGYERDNWAIYLWGRNILDKFYTVRGFFFANEPPNWIDKLYTRQGDPAYWGITLRIEI